MQFMLPRVPTFLRLLRILSLISHKVIGIIYAFYIENGFSKFVTVAPVPLNDKHWVSIVLLLCCFQHMIFQLKCKHSTS